MKKPLGVVVDLICFVIGPFITAVNAFNWTAGRGGLRISYENIPIAYYYPNEVRLGIGIGIALICFGILSRRWR